MNRFEHEVAKYFFGFPNHTIDRAVKKERFFFHEIFWKKFTQHLQLPSNAKGSIGELLFTLHEDNSWTCELVDPNDWTKKL